MHRVWHAQSGDSHHARYLIRAEYTEAVFVRGARNGKTSVPRRKPCVRRLHQCVSPHHFEPLATSVNFLLHLALYHDLPLYVTTTSSAPSSSLARATLSHERRFAVPVSPIAGHFTTPTPTMASVSEDLAKRSKQHHSQFRGCCSCDKFHQMP